MNIHENKWNWVISMDDLRKMLDVQNTYKNIGNFKKKILVVAKEQINKFTDLEINYENIISEIDGCSIIGIKFTGKNKIQCE